MSDTNADTELYRLAHEHTVGHFYGDAERNTVRNAYIAGWNGHAEYHAKRALRWRRVPGRVHGADSDTDSDTPHSHRHAVSVASGPVYDAILDPDYTTHSAADSTPRAGWASRALATAANWFLRVR